MEGAKRQAKELGIERDVIFAGNQKEVWKYYQAFDFFLFPSRFEGLPGTVIEAQAAGLRCLISDRITPETGISSLVKFEGLEQPPQVWAEYVLQHRNYERKNMCGEIKKAGFDVKEQAGRLERFYRTGKME